MRKFNALYTNELIKFLHKPFYIIVAVLIVVAMLLVGIVGHNSVKNGYGMIYETYISDHVLQDEKEYYRESLKTAQNDVEFLSEKLNNTVTRLTEEYEKQGKDVSLIVNENSVVETASELYYQICNYGDFLLLSTKYEMYDEYDVDQVEYLRNCVDVIALHSVSEIFDQFYEKQQITCPSIDEIFYALELDVFFALGGANASEDLEEDNVVQQYKDILIKKDYKQYVELKNKLITEEDSISETSKEIMKKANLLKLEINPDGTDVSNAVREKEKGIDLYVKYKTMAVEGKNEANQMMTPQEISEYDDIACEIELAVKKSAVGFGAEKTRDEETFSELMLQIGMGIASLAILLFAATSISDEFQSGSIKLLIITPAKRSKLFFAKAAAVITIMFCYGALIFLSFLLINSLVGFGGAPVVYTNALGNASSIGYYFYVLCSIFLDMVKLFVYGSFAIMLSTLLRNSALSICVTMFEYLAVSNILPMVINSYNGVTIDVVKTAMPETHISLAEKIFVQNYQTYLSGSELIMGTPELPRTSLWVSIAYTAILLFVFLYIGFDSFCRRDIK